MVARGRINSIKTSNLSLGAKVNPATGKTEDSKTTTKKKTSVVDQIAAQFGKRAPNFGPQNQLATTYQSQTQPSPTALKNMLAPIQAQQAVAQGKAIGDGIEGAIKALGKMIPETNKKADSKASANANGNSSCQTCQANPAPPEPEPSTTQTASSFNSNDSSLDGAAGGGESLGMV